MEVGSWIRNMFEEANALEKRYGKGNVFDLSIGNPVMEPPPEFKQQLKSLAEVADLHGAALENKKDGLELN